MIQTVSTDTYNNLSYVCYFMSEFQTVSFTLLSAFFDGWRRQSKSWNLAHSGQCLTGSPGRHKTPVSKTTFQVPD